MSDPVEKMSKLLRELEAEEIDGGQFQALSQGLIDSLGKDEPVAPQDPVRMERIEAAEDMLREL